MDQPKKFFFPLDPMQRPAVEAAEGVSIVIGCTGTGKTQVLVGRVAHLLESGVRPVHITCLASQGHSAEELRYRLASHPRINAALDHIFVGTVHEYANFFLRRAGASVLGESPSYTVWDRDRAVEAVQVAWPEGCEKKPPTRDLVAALDWYWRDRGRPRITLPYPAKEEFWLTVKTLYDDEKRRQGALDHVDLLVKAIVAMESDRDLRTEWSATRSRHLLLDHLEDLGYQQLALLRPMVGLTGSLTVTIDLNVSLDHDDPTYAVETFLLDHKGKGRRQYTLRLVQVSSRDLWEVTRALQSDANGRGLWDFRQACDGVDGGAPVLVEVEGTLREMYTHCLDEARRLADGGIPWEDMAVLYRRAGVDRRLETQLIHRDIPHHVLGNIGRDQPGDARLVVATLTCLLNPRELDAVRMAAAPGHPNRERRLRPNTSRRLRLLSQESGTHLVEAARRYMEELGEDDPDRHGLSWLVRVWDDLERELRGPQCSPLDLVLLALQRAEEVRPPMLTLIDDPQVDELRRLAAATPHQRGETPRMHLQRFLDRWATGFAPHSSGLRQAQGLTLAPIHAAKGRRWPVVFVLDVSDETIPGKIGNYSDRLQRELRLFYTAVTRATRSLYLYCLADTGRGAEVRPTRFLEPIMHLVERRRVGIREVWAGTGWMDGNRQGVGTGAGGDICPPLVSRDNA